MKLITGLGNPEEKYFETRHNVGFLFLDALHEKFKYQKDIYVTDWKREDMFRSELSFLKQDSRIIAIFQKPLTYMNKSGEAVAKIIEKYDIDNISENLLLIHDDLDISLGKFKIQRGKSPQGHNGVKNVEDRVGSTDFKRVRIGVDGRLNKNIPGEDYVLMKFSQEERIIIDEIIQDAIKGILADIIL